MTVVARIDSLIANLQGLKQAVAVERGTGFEVALNAALDEADAVVGTLSAAPVAITRIAIQDYGLPVFRNTDGTASVLFPGGGIHSVEPTNGIDPVEALQSAYGSRITSVRTSNKTAAELAAQQREVRAADELATVSATLANQSKYAGGAATGFDPSHVSGYLGSIAGQAAVPDTPAERYIAEAATQGSSYLSRYLAPNQISGMSQRQLLAANELMTQGGGVKEYNYLSNEDLDFIVNRANEFQGAVWSPVGQAISLGAGSGEATRYDTSQAPRPLFSRKETRIVASADNNTIDKPPNVAQAIEPVVEFNADISPRLGDVTSDLIDSLVKIG